MRRLVALLVLVAAGATSCGDPGNRGDDEVFTFTPVAVYTAGPGREGVLYSLDENCGVFTANEVQVTVAADSDKDVQDQLMKWGFQVLQSFESAQGIHMLVGVPAGSVPDAIEFIREHADVITVSANSVAAVPEKTSVAEILRCAANSN